MHGTTCQCMVGSCHAAVEAYYEFSFLCTMGRDLGLGCNIMQSTCVRLCACTIGSIAAFIDFRRQLSWLKSWIDPSLNCIANLHAQTRTCSMAQNLDLRACTNEGFLKLAIATSAE